MTQSFHQSVGNNTIHYLQFSHGEKLLVCFHGFGDNADSFKVLEPSLKESYSVISVDLPFHGKTKWKNGDAFTPDQANGLVDRLMKLHNVNQVSLAAFSIGGKIALKIFESNPEKVEELWLFAPDGLKKNIWYNIAVYPAWGRKLFRWLLDHHRLLNGLVDVVRVMKLVPKSFEQFLRHNLTQRESRERVWNTWIAIKGFEVPPGRLRKTLKQSTTRCYIVMGKFDPIIRPRIGQRFSRGITNAELHIIPKGHYLLKPYLNDVVTRILNK